MFLGIFCFVFFCFLVSLNFLGFFLFRFSFLSVDFRYVRTHNFPKEESYHTRRRFYILRSLVDCFFHQGEVFLRSLFFLLSLFLRILLLLGICFPSENLQRVFIAKQYGDTEKEQARRNVMPTRFKATKSLLNENSFYCSAHKFVRYLILHMLVLVFYS